MQAAASGLFQAPQKRVHRERADLPRKDEVETFCGEPGFVVRRPLLVRAQCNAGSGSREAKDAALTVHDPETLELLCVVKRVFRPRWAIESVVASDDVLLVPGSDLQHASHASGLAVFNSISLGYVSTLGAKRWWGSMRPRGMSVRNHEGELRICCTAHLDLIGLHRVNLGRAGGRVRLVSSEKSEKASVDFPGVRVTSSPVRFVGDGIMAGVSPFPYAMCEWDSRTLKPRMSYHHPPSFSGSRARVYRGWMDSLAPSVTVGSIGDALVVWDRREGHLPVSSFTASAVSSRGSYKTGGVYAGLAVFPDLQCAFVCKQGNPMRGSPAFWHQASRELCRWDLRNPGELTSIVKIQTAGELMSQVRLLRTGPSRFSVSVVESRLFTHESGITERMFSFDAVMLKEKARWIGNLPERKDVCLVGTKMSDGWTTEDLVALEHRLVESDSDEQHAAERHAFMLEWMTSRGQHGLTKIVTHDRRLLMTSLSMTTSCK